MTQSGVCEPAARGSYYKYRLSGLASSLLNQNMHFRKIPHVLCMHWKAELTSWLYTTISRNLNNKTKLKPKYKQTTTNSKKKTTKQTKNKKKQKQWTN